MPLAFTQEDFLVKTHIYTHRIQSLHKRLHLLINPTLFTKFYFTFLKLFGKIQNCGAIPGKK